MHWIDWLIAAAPLGVVLYFGWRVQRYITGVSDFMTAGRVAGRYLIAVADGAAALGLISVINTLEVKYVSGLAYDFWGNFAILLGFLLTLSGFIIYRYRETRVMTMSQFFELRYNKSFRVFSGLVAFLAGIINYAIFPAVGGHFIMYYCQMPDSFHIAGLEIDTFGFLMAFFLCIALFIVLRGGQLTNMVTDCLQGIFGYFCYAAVAVYMIYYFSADQFFETMSNRPVMQSFFNPFQTSAMQDFNVLFVLMGLFGTVYSRMSWQGNQGYYCAGVTPHEQKMGAVLGTWRAGFNVIMVLLMAFGVYIYMNHPDFAEKAAVMQSEIANRISAGVSATDIQATNTLRTQMTVPMVLRQILPVKGMTGIFFAMMMFLMISTDSTYLHSWGSIFIQDVVLPFRKKPFTPKQQLMLLRIAIVGVAVFAWSWSFLVGQTTYIIMFFSITGAIYAGGAGSAIIGGLYWKKGTSAGAWTAMIWGAVVSVAGLMAIQFWGSDIYPWLKNNSPAVIENLKSLVIWMNANIKISHWEISTIDTRFPFSGAEMSFVACVSSALLYIIVSLLTCREDFNLDRMLHRGIYNREHKVADLDVEAPGEPRQGFISKFIGISPEYTLGDKILSWSVFVWSIYTFAVFLLQLLLVAIMPDLKNNDIFWQKWWLYYALPLALFVAAVSTVWFSIGGIVDLRKMFKRLQALNRTNAADDGRVVGHVNTDDLEKTVFVESLNTEELEAVEESEVDDIVTAKVEKREQEKEKNK
ncbi:MAG: sodium:solute symporter [Victivallaceae bacterium]